MLSGLLCCLLVVGALASDPGKPSGAAPGQPEPKRCCSPRYFTADETTTVTSVNGGKLVVEIDTIKGAYDAISERIAASIVADYLNGTAIHLRVINLYEEGAAYFILEHQGESVCYKGTTTGRFPEDCLTDEFKFVNTATLGDHAMELQSWYGVSDDGHRHVIKSVQEYGCTPVGLLVREFDDTSGQEITVAETRVSNFNLGICDPDEYFKPPESCNEGRALEEPTPEMVKFQSKMTFLRHHRRL